MIQLFRCFVILFAITTLSIVSAGCDNSVTQPPKDPQQGSEKQQPAPETSTEPPSSDDQLQQTDETNSVKGEQAFVENVVDGDTIEVSINSQLFKVRYIGVDTPETKDPRKPVQYYGKEAYQFNRKLVEGKTVELIKDVSDTDRYGRLLRYVYVSNIFVNAELVWQGYARASTYPPDIKYSEHLLNLEADARKNNRGLWAGEAAPQQSSPPSGASESQGNFVGNKNSKKLHNTTHSKCRTYIKAMNPSNKVVFSRQDKGIKAGYDPCKACY